MAFCSLRSPILTNYILPLKWALGFFVKFILVLLFILVSIPFFYIGKYLITSDYQKYIIEGTKTSNGNKLYLNRVKAKAELVNQFI